MLNNNPLLNMMPQTQPFQQPLIPNPFAATQQAMQATLGLTQIEGFEPVEAFRDSANVNWKLVKAASNSTIDIPDPKSLQIVSFWGHQFPGQNQIWLYVLEGVRQPRAETEVPSKIMYTWFSKTGIANPQPGMITDQEWRRANVYAAPIVEAWESQVQALCRVSNVQTQPVPAVQPQEMIKMEPGNGHSAGN